LESKGQLDIVAIWTSILVKLKFIYVR
jgi:hypothetical protein